MKSPITALAEANAELERKLDAAYQALCVYRKAWVTNAPLSDDVIAYHTKTVDAAARSVAAKAFVDADGRVLPLDTQS
jgi:hypothetical protein